MQAFPQATFLVSCLADPFLEQSLSELTRFSSKDTVSGDKFTITVKCQFAL